MLLVPCRWQQPMNSKPMKYDILFFYDLNAGGLPEEGRYGFYYAAERPGA